MTAIKRMAYKILAVVDEKNDMAKFLSMAAVASS
jgi:hypothetical protein